MNELLDRLRRESAAMFDWAMTSGLKVPPEVAKELEANLKDPPSSEDSATADVKKDCSKKKQDPATLVDGGARSDGDRIAALTDVHNNLVDIVAPAKPCSILLLNDEREKTGFLSSLGAITLIRQMIVVSVLSLAAMLGFSLFYAVNAKNLSAGILNLYGTELLKNLLFILSAASLGSAFSVLYKANHHVTDGTFEPQHASSYWARYFLGLVAGIILAEVVPPEWFGGDAAKRLAKPICAILGGFSASAVYSALNTLVGAVEKLFTDRSAELLKDTKETAERKRKESIAAEKVKLAQRIAGLKKAADKANYNVPKEELDKLMEELVK